MNTINDRKLSENFTLFELTRTTHEYYQSKNRQVSEVQIEKLISLSGLLEKVRDLIGCPLKITSAYRCPDLNSFIGSTSRSQHLLCEAADFVPIGKDLGDSFRKIWKSIKDGDLHVGQLIHETANRGDAETSWIHISVGSPYRANDRCNQVLRMQDGKYTMLA